MLRRFTCYAALSALILLLIECFNAPWSARTLLLLFGAGLMFLLTGALYTDR